MRPTAHRLLAALLLAVWLTPGAGALAVGVHLALDHHRHEGEAHDHPLEDLARAASHGHHHGPAAAADHEHALLVDSKAPALKRVSNQAAVLPSSAPPRIRLAEGARLGSTLRRGPPQPLFTAHCSLLL